MIRGSARRSLAAAVVAVCTVLLVTGCGEEEGATGAASAAPVKTGSRSGMLTQDQTCLDGDPACTPTGAHARHASYACSVCHKVAGRLVFDRNGPAYAAGQPAPTFDATAKTCSNVACHSVSGTFTYERYNWGSDSYDQVSFAYGGSGSQPNWYATGSGTCSACHGMPPTYAAWHSGQHGTQPMYATTNACQTCHPDASGLLVYGPTGVTAQNVSITNPSLHRDGTLQVTPRFTSACFGCH